MLSLGKISTSLSEVGTGFMSCSEESDKKFQLALWNRNGIYPYAMSRGKLVLRSRKKISTVALWESERDLCLALRSRKKISTVLCENRNVIYVLL